MIKGFSLLLLELFQHCVFPSEQRDFESAQYIISYLYDFAERKQRTFSSPILLLGCQDSNLGVAAPKAAALPLGYTPIASGLPHKKPTP